MGIMAGIIDIFKAYSKEALVGYFLMVWGAFDLVDVVWGLYYLGGFNLSTILDLVYVALNLLSGLILVTLGTKILNDSKK